MCTICSNDFDCYFDYLCVEGKCLPPVKGVSGEAALEFEFSQVIESSVCRGSLLQSQLCPLVTFYFNPGLQTVKLPRVPLILILFLFRRKIEELSR